MAATLLLEIQAVKAAEVDAKLDNLIMPPPTEAEIHNMSHRLAQAMIDGAADDIHLYLNHRSSIALPDLLGDVMGETNRQQQIKAAAQDALIWIFGLNPSPPDISFEAATGQIEGFDVQRFREVVASVCHRELRETLRMVWRMVDKNEAQVVADRLARYVNIDGVRLQ
jgi:hypothetical protein